MIKIGSDFSGVGAFNQALMRLGIKYKEVFACDMDKYARETFIYNYGEPSYYPENVYDREIPKQSLDIYMTSPPCQAFSLAGKRKGEDDKRGILFYNSHEFIVKNKPRYFIFENVKGLLSDAKGGTFQIWLDMLGGKSVNGNPVIFPREDATPYHIYYKVLNAKNYGVPQNRERVFIIGIRDDADNIFSWPMPFTLKKRLKDVLEENVDEKYFLSETAINHLVTHKEKHDAKGTGFGVELKDEESIAATLRANGALCPTDNHLKVKSATSKGYEMATENDSINLSNLNSETKRGRVGKEVAQTLDTTCAQGILIKNKNGTSNTITSVQKDNVVVQLNLSKESGGEQPYKQNRIYDADFLSPVLDTECGRPNYKIGYRIRRLTPREAFRLMDFPDTFTWPVSNSQAYKQAGNSIVVNVLVEILKKLNLEPTYDFGGD